MRLDTPPRTPSSATRARIGILAAVVVLLAVAHYWYGNRNHFLDLRIYLDAMTWWDDGHPLYGFVKPDDTQGALGYTYPPFTALLMRPMAWLPLSATAAMQVLVPIYTVLSVAAFAACVWWLVRPLAQRHQVPAWFVFGLAFALASTLEPIREALTFGQINFLLWVLILFDLLVLLPRGSRFVGVAIGLATAIKLVPGIFIVYLLVTRRLRAAAVAAGTTAAATLLAAVIAPSESWTFFTDKVLEGEGVGQLAYQFNQSVNGVLARLAEPALPNRLLWFLLILPILGYGLWRAGHAAAAGDEVAGLTLTGIVGSLVSPVTWAHHIFWIVPALVALVAAAWRPDGPVLSGLRGRAAPLAFAAVIYVTISISVVALWSFKFDQPGGVTAFVMSNWYVWVMLALLPLLPIRRQPPLGPRESTRTESVALAQPGGTGTAA